MMRPVINDRIVMKQEQSLVILQLFVSDLVIHQIRVSLASRMVVHQTVITVFVVIVGLTLMEQITIQGLS
jgi:hypothetical protein